LAVAVVDDFFAERLARTLGDAALDLALGQERVDDGAAIVDDGIAVDRDRPGVGIDLDLADMAAVRKARQIRREAAGALQADPELRRQAHRDERHLRHLQDRHRPVGAGDREGAVGKGDVGGVGLHEMRGKALAALDDLVGRGAQCAAADHHAARGISAAADRDLICVGLQEMDLIEGHAEPVGGHLRIARLVPLPV
jgi:hypothetical protein